MQTDYLKAVLMAAWVLAVSALGYVSGITSLAAWAAVAVVSLVPVAIMVRLWRAPSPTMSETIRGALR